MSLVEADLACVAGGRLVFPVKRDKRPLTDRAWGAVENSRSGGTDMSECSHANGSSTPRAVAREDDCRASASRYWVGQGQRSVGPVQLAFDLACAGSGVSDDDDRSSA